MADIDIYREYSLVITDSTDRCTPPCHMVQILLNGPIDLAELGVVAERILAYEREVEVAEGRELRRKAEPCRCGARGATLMPGPLHFTSCTLWTVER
jgi:hypothetical protein